MSATSNKLAAQQAKEEAAKYKRMYETIKQNLEMQSTGEQELLVTMDYDMFDSNEFNRPLHHNIELERKMREYGFDPGQPISATRMENGRLKIRYGHNRFATAKKLGIPVHCMVNNYAMSVIDAELNGSKKYEKWSVEDVVTMWANQGRQNYLTIIRAAKHHSIGTGVAAFLFAGGHTATKKMREGALEIKNAHHAYKVLSVAKQLLDRGVDFAMNSNFLKALFYVLQLPEVDKERLIARFTNMKPVKRRPDIDGYCEMIEKIYNYRIPIDDRVAIAHLARCLRIKRAQATIKQSVTLRPPDWEV